MKIEIENNTITVIGLVDTVKVSEEISNELDAMVKSKKGQIITLDFKDTFVITSSLIGSLLGAVQRDDAKLTTKVGHKELYDLLDKLSLIKVLNVIKY